MADSHSFPSTLDQTSTSNNDKEDKEHKYMYIYDYPSDEDDEYVQALMHQELTTQSSLVITDDWLVNARLDSIKWIFNAMKVMGFQLRTAYLSVTYHDKFLSRRMINNEKYWAFRLLSVACLSLAAKMEECKVHLLTDFPMEDYNFESRVIQRMELLVLNTLEWKLNFVTPFHYYHYFVSKFWNLKNSSRNVMATDLVFAIIKDASLMNQRSSVIAAAATLLAFDGNLTKQGLDTCISTHAFGILDLENVCICYNQMQELCADKTDVFQSSSSPNLAPINQLTEQDLNTKRKRLEFSSCVQDNDMPIEKRHQ